MIVIAFIINYCPKRYCSNAIIYIKIYKEIYKEI